MILRYNENLIWQSDWGGDETGWPEVNIVGLYMIKDTDIHLYIDMEENMILSAFDLEDSEKEIDVDQYTIEC